MARKVRGKHIEVRNVSCEWRREDTEATKLGDDKMLPDLGVRVDCCVSFSFQVGEQVIIQVWISTHFGVLSEQLPDADENSLFIKATFTPAPVPL